GGHLDSLDGDLGAVEVVPGGGPCRGRGEVDVGLAEGALLADAGPQRRGHWPVGVDVEFDADDVAVEFGRRDSPDPDAQVGDLGAREGAAGRRGGEPDRGSLLEGADPGEPDDRPPEGDDRQRDDDRHVGQLPGREPHGAAPAALASSTETIIGPTPSIVTARWPGVSTSGEPGCRCSLAVPAPRSSEPVPAGSSTNRFGMPATWTWPARDRPAGPSSTLSQRPGSTSTVASSGVSGKTKFR